ncbi:hypothetical protein CLV85_2329 [Salinibacterium amurskyense]|uniref:Uncharacterized protein n=1 Tax=Salinibacterium amurskyense TaxID=205941 RepID=A0A2M9D3I9_9MICO|nr:hypothetical protein CLV85_2329 [Salinibacterium amurskyense]
MVVVAIIPIVVFFFAFQVYAPVFALVRLPGVWNAARLSRRAAASALLEASNLTLYTPLSRTSESSGAYAEESGVESPLSSDSAGSTGAIRTVPDRDYDPVGDMTRRVRQLRIVAGLYALAAGMVPLLGVVSYYLEL